MVDLQVAVGAVLRRVPLDRVFGHGDGESDHNDESKDDEGTHSRTGRWPKMGIY